MWTQGKTAAKPFLFFKNLLRHMDKALVRAAGPAGPLVMSPCHKTWLITHDVYWNAVIESHQIRINQMYVGR